MSGVKVPLAPLVPFLDRRLVDYNDWQQAEADAGRLCPQRVAAPFVLADMTGCHRRTPYRWMAEGLGEREAERLALELGRMPHEIWPDWYDLVAPGWEDAA